MEGVTPGGVTAGPLVPTRSLGDAEAVGAEAGASAGVLPRPLRFIPSCATRAAPGHLREARHSLSNRLGKPPMPGLPSKSLSIDRQSLSRTVTINSR